jgi:3'(2'), 5'-bisphosphate nucleotidase
MGGIVPAVDCGSVLDSRIIDVARGAVRSASQVCLGVLAEAPETPESMAKLGREPVTVADYGSQAVILEAVQRVFPGHGVVAEERAEHLVAQAGEAAAEQVVRLVAGALGRPIDMGDVVGWIDHRGGDEGVTWAIDPIDGTKGFLRREQFAIAVGVVVDGVPVAGVLGCPHFPQDARNPGLGTGVLYWGVVGGGAYAEPLLGGPARPVAVSDRDEPGGVRVLGSVEAGHGDPALVSAVIAEAGLGGGMVRIDSQVKYAAVADGAAEVYLRPRNRPEYREQIWDHAAGAAIVTAAGGRVTDLDGALLDFSTGSRLEANRGVLASNGAAHDLVLDALRIVEAG